MFNPSLHSLFVQTRVAEQHSEAAAISFRRSAALGFRPSPPDASAETDVPGRHPGSTGRFLRHYAEMVVVMFAGMFVLMAPTGWLLGAFGTSWSGLSPTTNMFAMALTMTAPMVAWMRYRGHEWRPNVEMAASMLVPTAAVIALLAAHVATTDTLMVPEHVAMLSCMLVAMLLRRDEYSCATHVDRTHRKPACA
jgi:hypothetical protein